MEILNIIVILLIIVNISITIKTKSNKKDTNNDLNRDIQYIKNGLHSLYNTFGAEINKLNMNIIKEMHNIKTEEYKNINETLSKLKDIQLDIIKNSSEDAQKLEKLIRELLDELKSNNIKSLNEIKEHNIQSQKENIDKLDTMQLKIIEQIKDNHSQLYKDNSENISKLQQTLQTKLLEIKESNEKKLNDIQENVNKKLDTSLNARLDSSFKQVGDQLQSLYKSIGELQSLSVGVTDLQKTLSNVKTRGVFGETQLRNIITNILDKSQFDENVSTKHNLEFVEFAVKIPDKENYKKFIYLPIDSKFPGDIYNKIVEASVNANKDELNKALKEFEIRIKQEAKTISEKYINTPETTDFAIMFLPTEGLYSEALKISNLVDYCQDKHKVIICGPSTITALINSLSIGFRYLTINKNSEEILKILSSCKVQYEKFRELIMKTQKKLTEAQNLTNDLQHRNDLINKKLYRVDSIEKSEAERLLELEGIIDGVEF